MDNEKFEKIIEHLKGELQSIRTGRAVPTILENVEIDVYGQKTPVNQLGNISSPEPQTLTVEPWDKSIIKDVEKGIREANLDLNPVIQGEIIRISFPPLTEDKRIELTKIMGSRVEDAKIALKNVREDLVKDLKNKKNNSELSEDEFFREEKEVQKVVDEYQDKIKKMSEEKEKDIMTI
ncbi:ribosome recycling factor [Patescibacteria group bacterium]|nr:ribosome recycling factor [Patescibacteria group bacterium]MBU1673609.1 ribosome recycling factor [Patescibacteria group bacterium]MBU1964029.1 ribosome recycling factor [Patescibacteria group bacterium]